MADKLICNYPDVSGIYINSANSITICKKIIEKGLAGKIKIVASDVFPELAGLIRRDIVHATMFQDPYTQGKMAFENLFRFINDSAETNGKGEKVMLNPVMVVKSNLELYT